MKLIFLHGAPATGKLTIAKALLRTVSGRLFDNHAAIDLAQTVFDFGVPGLWELVHIVRLSVLVAAAERGVPLVVATYCYAEPDDRAAFEQIDAILQRHEGELLPVFLRCSKEEIVRRVSNADRAERRKITSEKGLNKFLTQYNISPVPSSATERRDRSMICPAALRQGGWLPMLTADIRFQPEPTTQQFGGQHRGATP